MTFNDILDACVTFTRFALMAVIDSSVLLKCWRRVCNLQCNNIKNAILDTSCPSAACMERNFYSANQYLCLHIWRHFIYETHHMWGTPYMKALHIWTVNQYKCLHLPPCMENVALNFLILSFRLKWVILWSDRWNFSYYLYGHLQLQ